MPLTSTSSTCDCAASSPKPPSSSPIVDMLIILRIVFGAAFVYGVMQMAENAERNLETGDLTNAFWVGYCCLVGLLNAAVWAPFIGEKISQPITGTITKSTYVEQKN